MKICPYCSKEIEDETFKCYLCGEFLKEEINENSISSEQNGAFVGIILASVIFLGILIFILFFNQTTPLLSIVTIFITILISYTYHQSIRENERLMTQGDTLFISPFYYKYRGVLGISALAVFGFILFLCFKAWVIFGLIGIFIPLILYILSGIILMIFKKYLSITFYNLFLITGPFLIIISFFFILLKL